MAVQDPALSAGPPPPLDAHEGPPPAYTAAPEYKIGSAVLTKPLVKVEQLKAHLALLKAFRELRTSVEQCGAAELPVVAGWLKGPERWAWFVELAVERFHRWLTTVPTGPPIQPWTEREVPPTDVLMVWHAYMLNPRWYAEDCERLPLARKLKALNGHFMHAMMMFSGDTLSQPSFRRMNLWTVRTGLPFHPLEAANSMARQEIQCPACHTSFDTPYLSPFGSSYLPGYAQPGFAVLCKKCKFEITKERLGLGRFATDLSKNLAANGSGNTDILSTFLAGTLLSRSGTLDIDYASRIKNEILSAHPFKRGAPTSQEEPRLLSIRHLNGSRPSNEAWARDVQKRLGYSLMNAQAAVSSALDPKEDQMVDRMMRAYWHDRPFSIDLAAAVVRQGSFVEKMSSLGWTNPYYFDGNEHEGILPRAMSRYCGFLDLMHSSPTSFFVPTLDIDLVWHTHQIMGDQYSRDCVAYVGRFIDHDDTVDELRLSNSFGKTCEAWQGRFGYPYVHERAHTQGADVRIGDRRNYAQRDLRDGSDASVTTFTDDSDTAFDLAAIAVIESTASTQPDFWERAIALGNRVQEYVEQELDQQAKLLGISGKIETFKLAVREVITSAEDMKAEKLFEQLKEEFPPPDCAPNHEERLEKITSVMNRTTEILLRLGVKHGMDEETWRARLDKLQDHAITLLVLTGKKPPSIVVDDVETEYISTGDLAEQLPVLLQILLFAGTILILPESSFLRPLLSVFGFGPSGPIRGSSAAWAQRTFFGAAVKEGSWFSHLQRAGMTTGSPSSWWKTILGGIGVGIGVGRGISGSCGSRR
ncbi:hypothetical protein OBBRIDRAFT_834175 [Obba rivulosa]|uniref:Uncharacterized protein n=1 Tax=Obba rivulosa TaxID=1052685 RepID=A0A8E2AVU2_9APHY|nr:hypothetical protein OBBRIDRAFT_834175 [Obba rivulosa]